MGVLLNVVAGENVGERFYWLVLIMNAYTDTTVQLPL